MRIHTRTRRIEGRTSHFVISASVILTTGLAAPTLEAGKCNVGENTLNAGGYSVKRVLPFLGDRCVQVKPVERKLASPVPHDYPSRHPSALSGDTR
jgi:hypothetical protein